jgi:hypothetical protein
LSPGSRANPVPPVAGAKRFSGWGAAAFFAAALLFFLVVMGFGFLGGSGLAHAASFESTVTPIDGHVPVTLDASSCAAIAAALSTSTPAAVSVAGTLPVEVVSVGFVDSMGLSLVIAFGTLLAGFWAGSFLRGPR